MAALGRRCLFSVIFSVNHVCKRKVCSCRTEAVLFDFNLLIELRNIKILVMLSEAQH
jgi:hypothetical protein